MKHSRGIRDAIYHLLLRDIYYFLFILSIFIIFFLYNSSNARAEEDVQFVCVANITDVCSGPWEISDVEWLMDDTHLIISGTYKALWNRIDGTYENIGLEHSQAIALDSRNERLASASSDKNVGVYNLTVHPPRREEVDRDSEDTLKHTKDVVFGRDSSTIFTINDKEIFKWVYDGYRWRYVDKISIIEPTVQKTLWALFFNSSRDRLVVMTSYGDCILLDTALSIKSSWNNTEFMRPDVAYCPPYYTSYCLLSNWTIIWCNNNDQYILLNLSTGKYYFVPMKLGPFHHISQSHNGKWLAEVSHGQVSIYNASSFERLTWFLCSYYVTGIAWSPDDRYLATADERENLQIWENIKHPGYNNPPSVEISSPADGETVSNTIYISGNATDDKQVVNVILKIDDGDWLFTDGSSEWQFQWDTRFYSNGLHRISVRAFDGERFSQIIQICLYIDNNESTKVLPTVMIEEPINGTIVSGLINIWGRAYGPNPIQRIQLSYNEVEVEVRLMDYNWSDAINTLEMPNGTLGFSAIAYDGLWYSNPAIVIVIIRNNGTVINEPPFVKIFKPMNEERCSSILYARGSAADEERRLQFVLVRVDDDQWQSASYLNDWLYEWTFEIDTWKLENGLHFFSAICSDEVQLSAIVTISFIVENDLEHPYGRPNVKILEPTNGSMVSGVVRVIGTADTESLIDKIQYSIDGKGPFLGQGKTNWTFLFNSSTHSNGLCELKIWAVGYSRNSSELSLVLNINNDRPPVCTITWPINNQTLLEDIEIKGTSSDPENEVPIVEIQIDKSKWIICTGNRNWSYFWDIANVGNGMHTIRAKSFDGANYSEVQEVVVQIYHPTGPVNHISKNKEYMWVIITIIIIFISVLFIFIYRFHQSRKIS